MLWKTTNLGNVCELIKRGVAPKYLDEGGICVLNQKCIRDHSVNYELSRRHNLVIKKVNPERYVQIGDVVVNSTGTGTLGRIAQIRSLPPEPTTVDTHVTIVRPKEDLFYNDFFGYMLIKIENEIALSGEGASGQTELARTTLEQKFEVSFPDSLPEQKRIVAILDEAFAGISLVVANAEKNLANARELFESYLNNIFTQKGDGWEEKSVGDIAEHRLGKMLDKQKNKGVFKPYLRNLNVRWFSIELDDLLEMRFEQAEEERYSVKKGDLLICEGGYPGRAAIWEGDETTIFFQKALHRVRSKEPLHNKWILYFLYLSDVTGDIKQYFTGAGIQHFTGQSLKRFYIPIPPIEEISLHLKQFDFLFEETIRLETIYKQKLTALNELKQSILQKAFTGELTQREGSV